MGSKRREELRDIEAKQTESAQLTEDLAPVQPTDDPRRRRKLREDATKRREKFERQK